MLGVVHGKNSSFIYNTFNLHCITVVSRYLCSLFFLSLHSLVTMTQRPESLSREEIELLGTELALQEELFGVSSTAVKEKEILHSHRVKLTDYIHDVTMLFPYMKEKKIFSVYDCDVIKGAIIYACIKGGQKENWLFVYLFIFGHICVQCT